MKIRDRHRASFGRGYLISLLLAGFVLGIVGVVGFNAAMEWTNTDSFCLGCHNHQIPYEQLTTTVHYQNRHGVVAGCADCHVPHEFLPKMVRKLEASQELWSHLRGVIDTEEKYLAHVDEMKTREITRLKASDSAPCRHCHDVQRMDTVLQSETTEKAHRQISNGKTCIDCHQGIAHSSPDEATGDGFDF